MITPCPHHGGCEAWTGEERRDEDGDYQWECATGWTWFAGGTSFRKAVDQRAQEAP